MDKPFRPIQQLCAEILRHLDNSLWLIERTDNHQYRTGEIMPKCCPPIFLSLEMIAVHRFSDEDLDLTNNESVVAFARIVADRWIEGVRKSASIGKSNLWHSMPTGIICVGAEGWKVFCGFDTTKFEHLLHFPYVIEREPKAGIF